MGNSRNIASKNELKRSDRPALVDGDIGQESTARRVVETAVQRFGSIDALVNNAGIFIAKPFVEYTQRISTGISAESLSNGSGGLA